MGKLNKLAFALWTNHSLCLEIALCAKQRTSYRSLKFNLRTISNEDCVQLFRFDKSDIIRLAKLLRIPFVLKVRRAVVVDRVEALCILLRRLSYPNRLCELKRLFLRTEADLSRIVNYMLNHLDHTFGYLLDSLDQPWLTRNSLQNYADAISIAGSPLPNCWGFIDGTVRAMCRPKNMQRSCYNGHKRLHGLKFQSVVIPNGIIANLWGPMEGRRHDSFMLSESQLLTKIERMEGQEQFYLYGDSGYPMTSKIIVPFKGAVVTAQERNFNKEMSRKRINVEQTFAKVISLFAFVDFKKNLRLHSNPVGMYYKCSVFLTNCHTCIYGSLTSTVYGLAPPTLEEYLREN